MPDLPAFFVCRASIHTRQHDSGAAAQELQIGSYPPVFGCLGLPCVIAYPCPVPRRERRLVWWLQQVDMAMYLEYDPPWLLSTTIAQNFTSISFLANA